MAKDILIVPGSSNIHFSGSAANNIKLETLDSGSVAFTSTSGSLFTITNSLTGSLFSVGDVSGVPILDVNSDDTVTLGQFSSPIKVLTNASSHTIISGSTTSTASFGRVQASTLAGNSPITIDAELKPTGIQTFTKAVYAGNTSENFFRIKLQDFGGTTNDVGIGQGASGNMGFNVAANGYYDFYEGTNGVKFRFINGRIGIGTTDPNRSLTIVGSAASINLDSPDNTFIHIDRGAADDVAEIAFRTGGANKYFVGLGDSGNFSDGSEFFIGEGSGGSGNRRITLDSTGETTFTSNNATVEIATTSNGTYGVRSTSPAKFNDYYFSGTSGHIRNTLGTSYMSFDASGNATIPKNLTVQGSLTAQEFITELNTTTIIATSGSTKFGNDSSDTHAFTGSIFTANDVDVLGRIRRRNARGSNAGLVDINTSSNHGVADFYSSGGGLNARIHGGGSSYTLNRFGIGHNAPENAGLDIRGSHSLGQFSVGDGSGNIYHRYYVSMSGAFGNGTAHHVPRGVPGSGTSNFTTHFRTAVGGGTTHHHIVIDGTVGIGTTSPAGDLHISNASPMIIFDDEDVSNLRHRIAGGGNTGLEYAADMNNVGTGYHRFEIGGAVAMKLIEGGKLRIGDNTNPIRPLDIGVSSGDNTIRMSTSGQAVDVINLRNADGRVGLGGDVITVKSSKVGIGNVSPSHPLSVSGAITIDGQNTVHDTSAMVLSQESSAKSQMRIYGADSSTRGELEIKQSYNDGNGTLTTLYLNSSGNVGINDSTPAAQLDITTSTSGKYGLQVNNNSGNQIFGVYNSGGQDAIINIGNDGGATKIQLLADGSSYFNGGDVAIGHTTPQVKLDVVHDDGEMSHFGQASTTNGKFSGISLGYRESNLNYRKAAIVQAQIGDSAARGHLHFLVDTTGDAGSAVLADSKMMIHGTSGYVGIGNTNPGVELDVTGKIRSSNQIIVKGNNPFFRLKDASDNNKAIIEHASSQTRFYTNAAEELWLGTNGSRRLTIASGGNVGIGTASPSTTRRLHIYNTDDTRGIYIENTSASSYAELHLKANREFRIGTGGSSSASEAQNRFYVYDATAAAHRFTIDSSGNVGINQTSPSYKLHVAGTAFATNLTLSGWSTGDGLTLNYGNSTGTVEAVSFLANGGTNGNIKMVMASANVGDMHFNASNRTNQLVMYRDGKVGVGTNIPREMFHTQGNFKFDQGFHEYIFKDVGISGQDYRHRYLLLFRVPTYGNTSVAVGFSGRLKATRVNELGVTIDSQIHITLGYGNAIRFSIEHFGGTKPYLVQYTHNSVDYLALYWYDAPGQEEGHLIGSKFTRSVVANWPDDNFGTTVHLDNSSYPSGNHSTAPSHTRMNKHWMGGNVGIGTRSAGKKLVVETTTDFDGILVKDTNDVVRLFNGGGNDGYIQLLHGNAIKNQIHSNGITYLNGGNVGIGTTSPTAGSAGVAHTLTPLLHLYSNTSGADPVLHVSCHNTDEASLLLTENTTSTYTNGWGTRIFYDGSNSSFFNIEIGDANVWTHRFSIDRYGKVAIGGGKGNTFSELLYVAGTGKFTGQLNASGNLVVTGTSTFNIDGDSQFKIEDAGSNAVMLRTGASDELYLGSNNTWQLRFLANGSAVEVQNGIDFNPNTDSSSALGTTSQRWSNLFTDAATIGGTLNVGAVSATGNISAGSGQIITPGGTNLALNPNTGVVSVGGVIQTSGTGNNTMAGNLTVSGTITAQKVVTSVISQSISFASGSNIFGDDSSDTHSFTGKTTVVGELEINHNDGIDVNAGAATLNASHSGGSSLLYSGYGISTATSQTVISNANKINFNSPGTTRMVVSSSGYVGIGDTDPQAKLHVEIASHNDAVGFYNGATALVYMRNESGTGRLTLGGSGGTINLESSNSRNSYINTSANFGIGTSSPTGGKLHVAGNIYATGTLETGNPLFNLSGTTVNGYAYGLQSFISTSGGWARSFRWFNNVNATARQTTFFVGATGGGSGTSYGYLSIGDGASSDTGYAYTKALRLYSDGDVTISDGNLAIGHTSPNFSLDVRKSTSDPVAFFGFSQVNAENKHGLIVIQSGTIPQSGGDLSGEAGIIFRHSGGTGGSNFDGNAGSIKSLKMDTYAATGQAHNRLAFSTTFNNTDSEKMTIIDSGNVGIGTNNPEYLLHLSGSGIEGTVVGESAHTGWMLRADDSNNRAFLILDDDSTDGVAAGGDYLYLAQDDGVTIMENSVTGGNIEFRTAGTTRLLINGDAIELRRANQKVSGSATSTGSFGHIKALSEYSMEVAEYITHFEDSDTYIRFQNNTLDLSAGGGLYRFQSTGLGIQQSSPEQKLHVGTAGSGVIKLALEWSDSNAATSGEAYSTIYTSGQGASYPFSGRGNLVLQPRQTDSNGYGDLVVMTGATATPKFVVQSGGNVGIGNTSPVDLLHVGAGADSPAVDSVAIFTHTGTTNVAIRDASHDVELLNYAYSGGGLIGTVTNHDLGIRTNNTTRMTVKSGGDVSFTGWIEGNGQNALYSAAGNGLLLQAPATTEKIFFRDQNGQVGMTYDAANKRLRIGDSTTPSHPLDVVGNARVSNNLYMNSYGLLSWDSATEEFRVYATSGNELKLSANGHNNHITIDTTGRVGINQTSPGAVLEVKGHSSVSTTALITHGAVQFKTTENDSSELRHQFNMGGAGDAGSYVIKQGDASTNGIVLAAGDDSYIAGNLGIGQASPSYKLHVSGTGFFGGALQLYSDLKLYNGTTIRFHGNGVVGMNSTATTQTFGSTAGNVNTHFSVGGITAAMVISGSTGNVGINDTTPSYKLDVNGTGQFTGELRLGNNLRFTNSTSLVDRTSDTGLIAIRGGREDGYWGSAINIYGGSSSGNGGNAGKIYFYNVVDTGTFPTVTMALTPGGKVGIGETSPDEALHIKSATSAKPIILLEGTNGSQYGPEINIYNNSASPADGDYVGQIDFEGNDSGGNRTVYGRVIATSIDVTNTIEDGILDLQTMYNGTLTTGLRIRGMAGGAYVGIGQTNPAYALDVTGTIRATADVIAYSDERVKDNIETIENPLDKIKELRGVSYNRNDIEDKSKKIGVIAQEVEKVLPEVVEQDDEGKYSVAYGNMVGLLIESVKEQQKQIEELKSEIQELKDGSSK